MSKQSKRTFSRSKRSRRKTNSGEEAQQDPVIKEPKVIIPVPAKEEAEVIDEEDALPTPIDYGTQEAAAPAEAVAETPEPPKEPGLFDHIDRKHFNDEWINAHHQNPADLLGIFDSLKKEFASKRALASPGHERNVAKLRERLEELRQIVRALGYSA